MAWRAGVVSGSAPERANVLVYGAGSLCTLFLRDRAVSGAWDPRTRQIVGLLDEDRNLHGRVVFGYKVLGGADRLRDACREHRVEELVITDPPPADVLKHLLSAAADLGVRVQRWQTQMVQADSAA
jgi:FlaA1/EpsC-like NDP-sugar epimerase